MFPLFSAHVEFEVEKGSQGWSAPVLKPWLEDIVQTSSQAAFGKPALFHGEGGSIPFMGMLGKKFPETQFVIIGVLGPSSNAHGPNEFLHLSMAQRLTACVANILCSQSTVATAKRRKKE
jgi:acetylornithine deacetylase/succinyl-diaminopimelate desuccinylase-like protein